MNTRLAVATFATLLSACASGSAADFEVPLRSAGGDAYTLLIYDDSGLVTAARSSQCFPDCRTDEVLAIPERLELEIGWTGGACEHRPRMQISGDMDHLQIDVYNPRDALTLSCPAVGIPLRVTLSLAEPVEENAVDLEVHYE